MDIISIFSSNNLLNLIIWIVLGLLSGLIAQIFDMEKVKGGFIVSTLVAVIGAVIGGVIAIIYFQINLQSIDYRSYLLSLAGALILVSIYRLLFRRHEFIKTKIAKV